MAGLACAGGGLQGGQPRGQLMGVKVEGGRSSGGYKTRLEAELGERPQYEPIKLF